MSRRIVLTGGLSGGHIYPLIEVARALREASKGESDIEFLFIGSRGAFESQAMESEGIPSRYIWTAKWRRYFSLLNILDIVKFPVAFFQALWQLFLFMPDVVFAKGGAVSVPVVLGAWLFRIPVMLHDSDAVAGMANRLIARFAQQIAIAYDYTRKYFPPEKVALTGNPVRSELLSGNAQRAREHYRILQGQPIVLIMGGSQGAQVLNEAILSIVPLLLQKNIALIHIAGEKNYANIIRMAGAKGIRTQDGHYTILPFLDAPALADCYAAADIIISRAGAGSIAEIAAVKKPSLLVPLASAANNEQRMNAYEVAESGGAIVLEESNLGPHILSSQIIDLLNDENTRQKMMVAVSRFYHPEAARDIARGILSLLPH